MQDGFARALACRDRFRGEGALEAWLWRIVLRTALDLRRSGRGAPLALAEVAEAGLWWRPELPYPERDPELDLTLRALSPRQRVVVFLRYFADLSHQEIAELTETQLGTVSATLSQAKSRLARRLDRARRMDEALLR